MDQKAIESAGYDKGLKAGIEQGIGQGIRQGIKQGIKQGIEQGSKQTNLEIAKKMIAKNIDLKTICEITGLSIEDLKNL